eukprot:TRINITY_DN2862_c0_g1_i1.p1 TRINITY_DN2862_c0_g1~~TRINITY_DN2862_c0_g1_i1.p1  ORF type:complete len:584 (-),score=212.48 TRINITY_DN2862_c0_g1_i1:69-1820(-)
MSFFHTPVISEEIKEIVAILSDDEQEINLIQVLSEETVPDVYEHFNQLKTYLTQPETVKEICQFVTRIHDDNKKASRTACKLLSNNKNLIRNEILNGIGKEEYFDIIFSKFVEDDFEMSSFNANLCARVITKFLISNLSKTTISYIMKKGIKPEKFPLLLIGQSSALLCTLLDKCKYGADFGLYFKENGLVNVLINAFSGEYGENAVEVASDCIEHILLCSINTFLDSFYDEENVAILVKYATDENNPEREAVLKYLIPILESLLKRYITVVYSEEEEIQNINTPITRLICQELNKFVDVIKTNQELDLINNTAGSIQPFGMKRIRVVSLIITLLFCNCRSINKAFIQNEIFSIFIKLFEMYPYNNILQSYIDQAFSYGLSGSQDKQFCIEILKQCELHKVIPKWYFENRRLVEEEGERPAIYAGFISTFGVSLLKNKTKEVKKFLSSEESWKKYEQSITEEYQKSKKSDFISPNDVIFSNDNDDDLFNDDDEYMDFDDEQADNNNNNNNNNNDNGNNEDDEMNDNDNENNDDDDSSDNNDDNKDSNSMEDEDDSADAGHENESEDSNSMEDEDDSADSVHEN